MKIVIGKEIQETILEVSNLLNIELRQIGEDYIEIRLVPHYENKVFFAVHDIDGSPQILHLPEANQVILNYLLENRIGTV